MSGGEWSGEFWCKISKRKRGRVETLAVDRVTRTALVNLPMWQRTAAGSRQIAHNAQQVFPTPKLFIFKLSSCNTSHVICSVAL